MIGGGWCGASTGRAPAGPGSAEKSAGGSTRAEDITGPTCSHKAARRSLSAGRDLAADADPAVNALLVHVLTRAGYLARHIPDPAAVTHTAAAGCGLVVLGSGRCGVSAAEAVTALRRAGVNTPALILVNGNDPDATALAADPSLRVLYKPFRPSEMAATVRELLGQQPASDAAHDAIRSLAVGAESNGKRGPSLMEGREHAG